MSHSTYKTFDPKRLTNSVPNKRTPNPTPDGKQAPDYYQIPLLYNNGTEENPIFDSFEVEGCELSTLTGLTSKPNPNDPTKIEDNLLAKFDPNNEDHAKFMEVFHQIYERCCELIHGVKNVVKKKDFDKNSPKSVFKYPVYIPTDELTDLPIPGKSPSMFLNIISRGPTPTLFVDGYNKPIDKKLLYNIEMKYIPLFYFKWIHVGTGIKLQIDLKSAAVTYVKKRNTESTQSSTINSLAALRPDYASNLANSLAKLQSERQEMPNPTTPTNNANTNEQNNSNTGGTLAGIDPTENDTPTTGLPKKLAEAVNSPPARKFKAPFNKD